MSVELESIRAQALRLSDDERAALALALVESLEDRPFESLEDVERAWDAEIKRRIDQIDSGDARFIPGDEAFTRLREQLG